MDNFWQIISVLVALSTLAAIVTGTSVYYMRKNTDDMKASNTETKKEIADLVSSLGTHIDTRIDRIHTRMDQTTGEVRDYIAKEVAQIHQKNHEQDLRIERGAERITKVNEDLLKFKLEVSEKYQRQQ